VPTVRPPRHADAHVPLQHPPPPRRFGVAGTAATRRRPSRTTSSSPPGKGADRPRAAAPDGAERVAAERRPVALRDAQLVVGAHVDERHRARQLEHAVLLERLALALVVLVVDVADDLLDEILHRHDPRVPPYSSSTTGELRARAPQVVEHPLAGRVLGTYSGLAHVVLSRKGARRRARVARVLGEEDAHHVVERARG
jgi:hypothetical protein